MTTNIKRTVLLIEDNALNREMLSVILSPTYHVMMAENGLVGLEMLRQYREEISLILLDIQMPVMNGYQFLDAIREQPQYSNIPIIVMTSSSSATDEIQCLENGASDFVSKPYNPDIVLRRVSSMIRLSESSSLINRMTYDKLTGLYSRDLFYVRAEELLRQDPKGRYDLLCSDIRAMKIINNRYGTGNGDRLITALAGLFQSLPDAICGRLGDDSLAAILPHQEQPFYDGLVSALTATVKGSAVPSAVVQLGLCQDVDHSLKAAVLCDNAILAISGIKQQYGTLLARYDEALKQRLIREQMIADSMESAIAEEQFQVYYQMKYHLQDHRIGGAEALVRWIHPEFGFLSPGEFIGLFERNRSITRLDTYMIERVCRDLRGWIDEGRQVVPVSVNVSRVDFDHPGITEQIAQFAEQYRIPRELLHIEVTESAYSETPELIFRGVEELRKLGFPIELDDFGAGYSSLNVLDTLNLDVLKLDMSLVRNALSEKRTTILKHIFSLAEKLKMAVVAEGIETEEQVNAFREMGCTYAQGYYYSKPLPKGQFEQYLQFPKQETEANS